MSDPNDIPHGRCAAYGCPMPGSLGSGGEWVCFCHHAANSADWQHVTKMLRTNRAIVRSVCDARRFLGTSQWSAAYRVIRQRLTEAGHADLLPGHADASPHKPGQAVAVQWLMRLETHLLTLCNASPGIAHPAPPPTTSGPAHIAGYLPDTQQHDAGDTA